MEEKRMVKSLIVLWLLQQGLQLLALVSAAACLLSPYFGVAELQSRAAAAAAECLLSPPCLPII